VARIRSDHARGYRATRRPERVTVGGADKRERAISPAKGWERDEEQEPRELL
jgi:hypothetical protein